MRKDFLPIAIGFWGIAVPLLVSVFTSCKTPAEKITVLIASLVFSILGYLISRAKA